MGDAWTRLDRIAAAANNMRSGLSVVDHLVYAAPDLAEGIDAVEKLTGVRATVRNGRIVLDEPTKLPEGTVLDLVLDDEGDDLDASERAARDASLDRSWQQAKSGEGRSADEVLGKLRGRK